MMRSLFAGISGLKAHQLELDVIANNIANVNTVGFKKQRVEFTSLYYQTIKGGMAPRGTQGGTNPQQIGLGVQVGGIETIFSKGSIEKTEKLSDLAIDGDGFFVLTDGTRYFYTRAGMFDIDADGYLVHTPTGMRLVGWMLDLLDENSPDEIDTNQMPTAINVKMMEKLPAKATTYIEYRSNLDARWEERNFPPEVNYTFYDVEGKQHTATIKLMKDNANPNIWRVYLTVDGEPINFAIPPIVQADWAGKIISGQINLEFDPDGTDGQPAKAYLEEGNTAGFTEVEPLADLWHKWIEIGANNNEFKNSSGDIAAINDAIDNSNNNISAGDRIYGQVVLQMGDQELTFNLYDDSTSPSSDYITIAAGETPASLLQKLNYSDGSDNIGFRTADGAHKLEDYVNFEYRNGKIYMTVKPNLENVVIKNVNFSLTDSTGATNKSSTSPFDSSFSDGDLPSVIAQREFLDGTHNITVSENPAEPAKVMGSYKRAGTDGDTVNDGNSISFQPWYLTEDTKLNDVGITDLSAPLVLTVRGIGEYVYKVNPSNCKTIGDLINAINDQTAGMVTAKLEEGQLVLETAYTGSDISLEVSGSLNTPSVYRVLFTEIEGAKIYSDNTLSISPTTEIGVNTTSYTNEYIEITNSSGTYRFYISDTGATSTTTFEDFINSLMSVTDANGSGLQLKDVMDAYIENGRFVLLSKEGGTGATITVNENGDTGGFLDNWITTGSATSATDTGHGDPTTAENITGTGKDITYNVVDKFKGIRKTSGTDEEVEMTISLENVSANSKEITIGDSNIGYIKLSIDQLKAGNATIRTEAPINVTEKVKMAISPTPDQSGLNVRIVENGRGSPMDINLTPGKTHVTNIKIYDRQGGEHNLRVSFEKIGKDHWIYKAEFDEGDPLNEQISDNWGYLIFDEYGRLDQTKTATANNVSPPNIVPPLTISYPDGTKQEISLDMVGVTQFQSETTTTPRQQNGYSMGMMKSFEIDEIGTITGVYDNGVRRKVGQIPLAIFRNPAGLESIGNTLFIEGANSGIAQIGIPNTGGRGKIIGSALEMSNVDLSEEFSNMIIAQRGFQANSRVISTSDRILEELVNLRR